MELQCSQPPSRGQVGKASPVCDAPETGARSDSSLDLAIQAEQVSSYPKTKKRG
jgi:hypothetical protein